MGLDPSLTSTGLAYRDAAGAVITQRISTDDLRGPWRLHYAHQNLCKLLDTVRPAVVAYEDYAMGKAKGGQGRIFDIGELGGVFKRELWSRGIDILLVNPTGLKKFVTGKGNPGFTPKGAPKLNDRAKKRLISAALMTDFGLDIQQNDEADAAGLLLIGEIHSGTKSIPNSPLKSIRADAVKQCTVLRGRLQSISKPNK